MNDIKKLIPHRHPFLLIDKVIDIKKNKSIIAQKNVSNNEPFFQGHFPGEPIMPGVLSLEVLCQAGSFLMLNQVDNPLSKNMFFTTVEKARFKRPIRPGDQLQIEVNLVKRKLNLCKFHGKCNIDGGLAVDAQFSANLVDRARE